MRIFFILNLTVLLLAIALRANAARIKDIANVRGVRENQLIGYGLVVGLNGTGDGKAEFTSKSLGRMLDSIGLKLDSKELGSKNVAAVLVTATLPPFARAGNKLDITVNSIG
ncbi:MAG TPA: flagellar basal body P-ring protein FlgI, partial [Bdellovibrionales bacterium]|nr:flagellar basal body P-ring protein FlgI [Bdellovibrionales bacterium]